MQATDFPPDAYGTAASGAFDVSVMSAVVAGLIVASIVGLVAWIWRGATEARHLDRCVDQIFDRILHKAKIALSAGNDEIIVAAKALRDAIDLHLGPTLAFAKGAGTPYKALDQALSGRKEVEQTHTSANKARCGCGSESPSCGCGTHLTASSAAASAAAPVIVNVIGGAIPDGPRDATRHADGNSNHPEATAHGAKGDAPKDAPKPAKITVEMSSQEQVYALARAVREFHAWWAQPHARKSELRAIVIALMTAPPLQPPVSGSGDHH